MSIKQPIIGNKKFKPDILKPTIKTYPLFSKEFKADLSYKSRKKIKSIGKFVFITFLVCLFIFPFGIFPKKVLDSDNNCITYNVFNQITHKVNLEDANEMEIAIIKKNRRRSFDKYYAIEVSFIFDNKVYEYHMGNFAAETNEKILKEMLRLKELFADGRYRIIGSDMLNNFLENKEYTNKEIELVYQLFDYRDN